MAKFFDVVKPRSFKIASAFAAFLGVGVVANSNEAEAAKINMADQTIKVQSGDILSAMPKKLKKNGVTYKITTADLAEQNNLENPNAIKIGQILKFEDPAVYAAKKLAAAAPAAEAQDEVKTAAVAEKTIEVAAANVADAQGNVVSDAVPDSAASHSDFVLLAQAATTAAPDVNGTVAAPAASEPAMCTPDQLKENCAEAQAVAVELAQKNVDAAQATVDKEEADVAKEQAELAVANTGLTEAQTELEKAKKLCGECGTEEAAVVPPAVEQPKVEAPAPQPEAPKVTEITVGGKGLCHALAKANLAYLSAKDVALINGHKDANDIPAGKYKVDGAKVQANGATGCDVKAPPVIKADPVKVKTGGAGKIKRGGNTKVEVPKSKKNQCRVVESQSRGFLGLGELSYTYKLANDCCEVGKEIWYTDKNTGEKKYLVGKSCQEPGRGGEGGTNGGGGFTGGCDGGDCGGDGKDGRGGRDGRGDGDNDGGNDPEAGADAGGIDAGADAAATGGRGDGARSSVDLKDFVPAKVIRASGLDFNIA